MTKLEKAIEKQFKHAKEFFKMRSAGQTSIDMIWHGLVILSERLDALEKGAEDAKANKATTKPSRKEAAKDKQA